VPEVALFNPFRRPTGTAVSDRALMLDGAVPSEHPAVEDRTLRYRLVRASRRTIAIHAGADGVEVRAPHRAALRDIEDFMRQKARWILRRLADARPVAPFRWEDGALLPLLGREVRLVASPGLRGIFHRDDELLVGDPLRRAAQRVAPGTSQGATSGAAGTEPATPADPRALDWRKRVLAWLRAQALEHYATRAAEYAAALDVPLPALKLSNAASQWGSCIRGPAHRGGVRVLLHWKLYLMPPHLVDYVVAHELAHIRELNHSPRFWAEVARVYPDPAAARKELNRLGRALPRL
jgi:predicted metal-dependent hydrolase